MSATLRPAAAATVYERAVFQDCHEVIVTLPVEREKVAGLVPDGYPLANDGEPPLMTVRAANCDYTIDGTTRETLEAEVRIDLDTPKANTTMNEGETNDSHIAGFSCCDWYELSEASNEKHFATWYRAGTGMDGVVVVTRDLEWRFDPDPVSSVGDFHFKAPSPSDWAFEISATLKRPEGPLVQGRFNIWHETDEGQVQITAHDDRSDSGLRFGFIKGTITTAHGSKLRAVLGPSRNFGTEDGLSGITAEIENGVLTKQVNR